MHVVKFDWLLSVLCVCVCVCVCVREREREQRDSDPSGLAAQLLLSSHPWIRLLLT